MRQGSDVGGCRDQSAGYVLSSGPASSAPKLHDTEPSLPSRARSALNGELHLQKADSPTGAVAGRVESGSQLDPKPCPRLKGSVMPGYFWQSVGQL